VNDDQFFLASTYLDGELTEHERARAEADPAVMAGVEQLRTLQGGIAASEPPSPAARNAALSAAMDEFARVSVPMGGTVATYRPRPVYRRVLAVAAAVVVVGMLGVVIVNIAGSDDSSNDFAVDSVDDDAVDDDSGDDAGADTGDFAESAPLDDEAEAEMSADMAGAPTAAGEESLTAEMAPSTGMASTDAADDSAEEGDAEESADGDAADDVFSRVQEFLFDPDRPVTDEVDLTAFGLYLRELELLGELPPTPNTICVYPDAEADVVILGQTIFRFPDTDRVVLVGVEVDTGQTFALDPKTCVVLVDGVVP